MAEFKLGNKALELYRYTLQVTRPVADDKVDAKDAAKVMKTIARAKTVEEMRELLLKTADRLEKARPPALSQKRKFRHDCRSAGRGAEYRARGTRRK